MSPPGLVTPGAWHHLALRWDGGNVAVFVDGKIRDSRPYDPVPVTGLSYHGGSRLHFGVETSWGLLARKSSSARWRMSASTGGRAGTWRSSPTTSRAGTSRLSPRASSRAPGRRALRGSRPPSRSAGASADRPPGRAACRLDRLRTGLRLLSSPSGGDRSTPLGRRPRGRLGTRYGCRAG